MSLKAMLPRSFMVFGKGYSSAQLFSDSVAGFTVAIIALPLAMAFAIASGVGPEKGLFTAIVAGFIISFLGGSRYQIGGPTGAFVVVLYGVILRHGYDGLVIATLLAGCMLMLMGFFRLGTIIKYIPYPVTVGFTSGIALIIFSSQLKDFLGLSIEKMPAEFTEQWLLYVKELSHINVTACALGIFCLIILIKLKHVFPKIPAPILVIVAAACIVKGFDLPLETIGSRFGALPTTLPPLHIPTFSLEMIRKVFPDALTIAILGAIESLLSCVVADGMTGDRHHSNKELFAQGIANIFSVLFGGIAATGAIARTATNIKSGAFSPLSGMIHAIMLLLFMFLFSHLIAYIPLVALSAILIIVAWNMSEFHHFKAIALKSERNDVFVLLITFALTVFIDLNTGVQTGIMLAGLLFIKRMIDVTGIVDTKESIAVPFDAQDEPYDIDDAHATSKKMIPQGVEVYEINGPFFFGIADRLKNILGELEESPKIFILRMRHVPMMDATGLHALEEFFDLCQTQGTTLLLSGVNERIKDKLYKNGLEQKIGSENITDHIDKALFRANEILSKE